jgi:hypothetical protein
MSDDTDWSMLRQASGTSEHVPGALRELLSLDSGLRKKAYWQLDNYVVLQGSLYEAAPFVVRALLQTWPEDDAVKDRLYDLLVELANGGAPEEMAVTWGGRQLSLKRATVDALLDGMERYARDLKSQLVTIRRQVVELLLALSDYQRLDFAELQRRQLEETDPHVRTLLQELQASPPGTGHG